MFRFTAVCGTFLIHFVCYDSVTPKKMRQCKVSILYFFLFSSARHPSTTCGGTGISVTKSQLTPYAEVFKKELLKLGFKKI